MAIVRLKRVIQDLENNTSLEIGDLDKVATTANYAGTSYAATDTTSGTSGTSGSSGTSGA